MALYPLALVLKTLSVKAQNVNEHKPSQHVGANQRKSECDKHHQPA
jgi:hypothetical protein